MDKRVKPWLRGFGEEKQEESNDFNKFSMLSCNKPKKRKNDWGATEHFNMNTFFAFYRIFNYHQGEIQAIADDLNRIYEYTYKARPFSVEQKSVQFWTKVKDNWFFDDAYEMREKQVYTLKGSFAFDWDSSIYTKMLRQVLDADTNIYADIIADKGPEQRSVTHGNTYHGLLTLRGGGFTKSKTLVYISNTLANYSANINDFTIGGVFLHEVLSHVHPGRAGTWALQDHYELQRSKDDHVSKKKFSNHFIK